MSNVFVMDHPLIQHKIGIIRRKETGSKEFREMISEIAMLMCYEATRDLKLSDIEIETPIAKMAAKELQAIRLLKERGVGKIRFMCIIAAPEGMEKMQREHPDVDIYIGALDSCLNEHGYIVPGLGDAGDRIFGTK